MMEKTKSKAGILGAMAAALGIKRANKEPDPWGDVELKDVHKIVSITPEPLDKLGKDVRIRSSDEGWIPYSQLTISGNIAIDTRDFSGKALKTISVNRDWIPAKCKRKPEKYYHTQEELVKLIDRLFTESGGPGTWRMLTLDGVFRTLNWQFKYMHIYKFDEGYLVCNDQDFVLCKYDLARPVNKEYLRHKKLEE